MRGHPVCSPTLVSGATGEEGEGAVPLVCVAESGYFTGRITRTLYHTHATPNLLDTQTCAHIHTRMSTRCMHALIYADGQPTRNGFICLRISALRQGVHSRMRSDGVPPPFVASSSTGSLGSGSPLSESLLDPKHGRNESTNVFSPAPMPAEFSGWVGGMDGEDELLPEQDTCLETTLKIYTVRQFWHLVVAAPCGSADLVLKSQTGHMERRKCCPPN